MFDQLIKNHNKPALHYMGRSYNYEQLLKYTHLYAQFYEQKSPSAERIMFFSVNTPEYVLAIYGAFRLGTTAIPVDVTATQKELTYMINDSRPEIIYTMGENVEFMRGAVEAVGDEKYSPVIFTHEDIDSTKLDEQQADAIIPKSGDDVMTIIYTSGTTGSPKGVMLTYSNLWYNVDAVANYAKIYKQDTRMCMLLPMHHVFAFAGALLAPLYVGGEIFMVESLTGEAIMKTMQEGRTNILLGVPRLYETFAKGIVAKINASVVGKMLFKLCSMINSRSLSKKIFKAVHEKFGGEMEFMVCGGAALPLEIGNIFKALGFEMLEGYGMTECAPMISFTHPGTWVVGYSGRILPGCEYKIGENEELLVRGANVMKGYYKREQETAEIMRDGWLHTGDTARYDESKGMLITGRIKEIIVTPNGKNINPASIENEISQCSQVIKEIAVVLHEDTLQAIIYPDLVAMKDNKHETLDELIRSEIEAYNKEASDYKRIRRYQIISQELPKTRLGKTQRFKLAQFLTEREEQPKEDISGRSETYRLLKEFVDFQTGNYANGDSHFEIDLALDSLGRVSLLSYVEDTFGVSISEAEFGELSTLNLLSEYIEKNSQQEINLSQGDVSWEEILQGGSKELKLPKSGFLHWFMHSFMWLFFSLFYTYRARGKENLPSKGAVLYVANHRSGLDGAFVSSHLSWNKIHNTLFFAKDKHFDSGFKKFMAEHNNIILMNINTNVRESMKQMYEVLSKGSSIVIFPEGTRSKTYDMMNFKESFAILSQALNIPIVPIAISGSESATYNKIRIPRFGNPITVEYLPTIDPTPTESTQSLTTRVKASIHKALRTT